MIDDTEEETKALQQWRAMKKRHAEALAKLQADNHIALVQLLAEHFAERDELKKLL